MQFQLAAAFPGHMGGGRALPRPCRRRAVTPALKWIPWKKLGSSRL